MLFMSRPRELIAMSKWSWYPNLPIILGLCHYDYISWMITLSMLTSKSNLAKRQNWFILTWDRSSMLAGCLAQLSMKANGSSLPTWNFASSSAIIIVLNHCSSWQNSGAKTQVLFRSWHQDSEIKWSWFLNSCFIFWSYPTSFQLHYISWFCSI